MAGLGSARCQEGKHSLKRCIYPSVTQLWGQLGLLCWPRDSVFPFCLKPSLNGNSEAFFL